MSLRCTLTFNEGTLILSGDPDALALLRDELMYDERIRSWRAPAYRYEAIMRILYGAGTGASISSLLSTMALPFTSAFAGTNLPSAPAISKFLR